MIIFVIGNGIYADHSCHLACQNMMLAAYSLGLGSCWVGLGSMVTEDSWVKKILDLTSYQSSTGLPVGIYRMMKRFLAPLL